MSWDNLFNSMRVNPFGDWFEIAEKLAAKYENISTMLAIVDDASELSNAVGVSADVAGKILAEAKFEETRVVKRHDEMMNVNRKRRIEELNQVGAARRKSSEARGESVSSFTNKCEGAWAMALAGAEASAAALLAAEDAMEDEDDVIPLSELALSITDSEEPPVPKRPLHVDVKAKV